MRLFHVWVTFAKKGTGYNLSHYARVEATSVETAASRGVRDAKKKYGRRFRIVEDATFEIKITAGGLVEREEVTHVGTAEPVGS